MSYNFTPPPPDPPSERRFRRTFWIIGAVLLALIVVALAVLLSRTAFKGLSIGEVAVPLVLAAEKERPVVLPGFQVGDEHGSIEEPPMSVVTSIEGRSTVVLHHLWLPGVEIEVPITELRMVEPFARQTKLGKCCGPYALSVGKKQPRNRLFYRPNPRVACAAYTAFILRHCGRPGGSFSASAQYAQLRKRGGRLVASKVSTRYLPFYKYFRSGDFVVFHKGGGRIGHIEIFVGNGRVSGTSSSAGRVAIRRLGNRGFSTCSVLRI